MGGSSHTFTKLSGKTIQSGSSSTKKTKKRIYQSDDGDEEEDEGFKKIITKTKVTIIKKGRKKSNKGHYIEVDESGEEEYQEAESEAGVFAMYENNAMDIRYRVPKPAVCMTWNGNKVKTFDGLTYTSNLYCAHTLIQDAVDGTFSVVLRSCPYSSGQTDGFCKAPGLVIFLQSVRYTFEIIGNVKTSLPRTKRVIECYFNRWIGAVAYGRASVADSNSETGHSYFNAWP